MIYQIEADDLKRIITEAVADAMKSYTANTTSAPAVGGSDLMGVSEVCSLLHVSKQTLFNWDKLRYLTKVKVGRRVLYHRSDVEALAAQTNTK